ncbi:MAG TPA: prolyl oligopeptidase family serine peptidase [Longimicrobiales bacterium]
MMRRLLHAVPMLLIAATPLAAQDFTIEEILAPAFPHTLVAAHDRIAWIEYERGVRNVHTAAAPDFEPVRLTAFTEDDGVDLTGLQLSDDGRIAMFIRGHEPNDDGWIANPSSDADGAERAAWAVRTDGGAPWRIAEAWDPVLSPDGRWIAYTRDGQIHLAPVDPAALADSDPDTAGPAFIAFGRNGGPVWSPDSRRIAFVSDRDDHSFIGVYDLERHEVRYLAPGVDHDDAPAWSPDGKRIAFIRRPGTPFAPEPRRPWWERSLEPDTALPDGMTKAGFAGGHTVEIWVADVETGVGRRIWQGFPRDERFTDIRALDWVGRRLVFRSEPGAWEGHRYAITVDDPEREPVELTPGDGFVEHVAFSPDGRWLYYTSNVGDVDRRHLWRVRVDGGEPERLTGGDGIETYPAVLASGDRVALLAGGADRPLGVAVVDDDGGEPRFITTLPDDFPRSKHVAPEPVILTAADGVRSHAQLFLPPDLEPGERRPALLFIHGGPRRQMLLGYHYMHFYHMAYAMNQYFANKGYVVLSVNYRSGIGYGTDFRDVPDYGRRGNSEYGDIVAAGLYLRSRPDVDPERIGLWGLSYGGILTAQGLARNSDIFKAGVDMAGVHLYGDADDPESTLYRSSAVAAIDTWTSPVLLIHGDDDRNVDFSQTVGLVQLLRAKGVPHELIVYPDEVHDFLLHSRWIRAFTATDDFFDRWLLGGRGVAAAGS